MCAGKHLLITLHVYVLLCRAHLYFYKRRLSEGLGDLLAVLSMTVMITKMGEGATSGTVIIRRNLPGFRAFKLQGLTVYDLLPGTKTANFSQWVEEPFDEMDSTLAVQQYIQQTIRRLQLRKALLPTLSHISKIQEPSRCGRDPDSP